VAEAFYRFVHVAWGCEPKPAQPVFAAADHFAGKFSRAEINAFPSCIFLPGGPGPPILPVTPAVSARPQFRRTKTHARHGGCGRVLCANAGAPPE